MHVNGWKSTNGTASIYIYIAVSLYTQSLGFDVFFLGLLTQDHQNGFDPAGFYVEFVMLTWIRPHDLKLEN